MNRSGSLIVLFINIIPTRRTGLEIIINAAKQLCTFHLRSLREFLADAISSVRLALATAAAQPAATPSADTATSAAAAAGAPSIAELIGQLYQSTVAKVRGVLQDLLIFVQPDLSFSLRLDAKGLVCIEGIREHLLVGFLRHAALQMRSVAGQDGRQAGGVPADLYLVLTKVGSESCRWTPGCIIRLLSSSPFADA